MMDVVIASCILSRLLLRSTGFGLLSSVSFISVIMFFFFKFVLILFQNCQYFVLVVCGFPVLSCMISLSFVVISLFVDSIVILLFIRATAIIVIIANRLAVVWYCQVSTFPVYATVVDAKIGRAHV